MAAPRQQRATRNRRAVTAANPPLLPQLVPIITTLDPTVLRFQCFAVPSPPDTAGTPLGVVLSGIPAIRRLDDDSYADSASYDATTKNVALTWSGGGMSNLTQFLCGPNDPAIRTPTGGFLAPGTISSPPLLPDVISYTITAYDAGAGTLTITWGPQDSPLIASPFLFFEQDGGTTPKTARDNGLTWDLAWEHALTDPPQIKYDAPQISAVTSDCGVPIRTIVSG